MRRIAGNNVEKELLRLLNEPFKLPNELLKFILLPLLASSCDDFLGDFALVVDFLVLLLTCGDARVRKLIIVWTTDFGAGGGSTLLNIIIVGSSRVSGRDDVAVS